MEVFVLMLLFNLYGRKGRLQNTSKTSFIICGEVFFKYKRKKTQTGILIFLYETSDD